MRRSQESVVGTGVLATPHVMLSPNAVNCVNVTRGGVVTVALNVHEAVADWLSVTVQVIVCSPTASDAPLAGVQATVSGGVPPEAPGSVYPTGIAFPSNDSTWKFEGQTMYGPSTGGVGCMGVLPPHADKASIPVATSATNRLRGNERALCDRSLKVRTRVLHVAAHGGRPLGWRLAPG